MKTRGSLQRSKSGRKAPPGSVGRARPFHLPSAIRFLTQMEAQVSRELTAARSSLPRTSLESDRTNLAHVLSHWHDDRDYLDPQGQPRRLALRGRGPTLEKLIGRIYPQDSVRAVVQALLRSGVVRRSRRTYVCTSRQLVFPPGVASYVSGLLPIQGLLRTLRRNLNTGSNSKLLQRSVTNARIPLREVPALYGAIDRRVGPLLEATDADMMRRELRGRTEEPLAHVGLSVEVFNFPSRARHPRRPVRRRRPVKRTR